MGTNEENTDGYKNFTPEDIFLMLPQTDCNILFYHVKYLKDIAFLECSNDYITDITPVGRSFLENIRNDGIWEEVKKHIQPLAAISLSLRVQLYLKSSAYKE
uniref:DUF2513 domain-containing protein n=1 Tax=uncultured Allisonella sp. TaxID=339338 RepID=UPI0034A03C4D